MKKLAVALTLVVAVSLAIYSQRITILTAVFETGLERQMEANTLEDLQDGLHLALCGAGGPMPAPNASGPCVAVIAGDRLFVVDAGTDGLRNLVRMGYVPGEIEAVFLTHFHSDHLDGLGEMATIRWVNSANTQPLTVHGPEGVQEIVEGFNRAYAQDFIYRHEHHGNTVAPLSGAGMVASSFIKPEAGELLLLIDEYDLKVEALAVDHSPVDPAVGYRFSYKDRSLLITGDTIKSANIEKFARGVDLLVHEALSPNLVNLMNKAAHKVGDQIMAKITYDILDYHASPVEAAETARDAGVGHLLYYHIVPPQVFPGQAALYLNGAEDIFPDYTIGQDGVSFSMPAGSKKIIRTRDGL